MRNLYSTRRGRHKSWASHIEFDRIFCGQYWDDFGCVGYLGDSTQPSVSVLMLGVADGAAIRPILASERIAELVGVDNDEAAIRGCQRLYDDNFPGLPFSLELADAKEYLQRNDKKFDIIVVDLYTDKEYSPLMFDHDFMDSVHSALNKCGHVLVNAYGIPTHLGPLEGNSPQSAVAAKLLEIWKFVRYIPHRRNLTFIASDKDELPSLHFPRIANDLSLGDSLFFKMMWLRLTLAAQVTTAHRVDSIHCKYVSIDAEMRLRWLQVIPILAEKLRHFSLIVEKPADLRLVLASPDICLQVHDALYKEKSDQSILFSILVAGEMNCSEVSAGWLPEWVILMLQAEAINLDRNFLTVSLPQAFSIVVNGNNQYRSILFRLNDAFESYVRRTHYA